MPVHNFLNFTLTLSSSPMISTSSPPPPTAREWFGTEPAAGAAIALPGMLALHAGRLGALLLDGLGPSLGRELISFDPGQEAKRNGRDARAR